MTISKKKLIYSCQATEKGKGLWFWKAKPMKGGAGKDKGSGSAKAGSAPKHCSQFAVAMA